MPEPAAAADATGPRAFSVEVLREGTTTVVAPVGEIDISTVASVREALEATSGPLVLDLRAVTFLDTTGLRLIVEQDRRARAAGRAFSVVAGSPDVQRIFDIAGLRDRLPFVDPEARAAAAGGEPPPA